MMPAPSMKGIVFDVSIDIHSHMNRLKPVPGYVTTFHIENRATRAGAMAHALGALRGLERKHVSYMQIQECPGDSRCWYARAEAAS